MLSFQSRELLSYIIENSSLSKCFSNDSRLIELEAKAEMNNLEASKNFVTTL
jgi:hypothetical protein